MDREEFRRRLAARPHAVRFEELERLLRMYGWELHNVRGSHHIFRRGIEHLSIPRQRPTMLYVYVRRVLQITGSDDD